MIFNVTLATKKQGNVSKVRRSFLGLLVVGATIITPAAVNAQGIGPDQDSLLPPEVVPLDPSAIKAVPSQSYSPTASNFGSQSVPGMSNGNEPAAPTQSAQDFRKAAFDQLYGQTPIHPQTNNPNLQMMQGQMGQMPGQMPGQPNQSQFGGSNPGTPGMVADNPEPTQSQTLSGGIKTQSGQKPSKLAKLEHNVGLVTSFGAAGMTGMSSGAGMYSLGLMGVSLLNMGMRNAFTHY